MKLLKYLRAMLGFSIIAEVPKTKQEKFDDVKPIPKPKVIPKGAMYFHFDNRGESVIGAWPLSNTVFSCVARSIKSANRKYYRWLEQEILKFKAENGN